MKKLLICLLSLFMIVGCSTSKPEKIVEETKMILDESIYNYVVNGQTRIIERGSSVSINRWNNRIETNIPEGVIPVFYKGLTIGSPSIFEFVMMFEIKAGYASVDRETDPYGDGCTDVINETYNSLDFLQDEHVLDAIITFYIENVDGKFILLPLTEGEEAWNVDSDRDILRINVDFVGECFSEDEGLEALTPIEIEFIRK